MVYEELFIESNKLPKPLSKSELYSYLKQYKQGDLSAREKVIIHNIRLVLNQVSKKFANTPYDKKELVSIGIVGLINSVDTFDMDKSIKFATYAIKCINNEILMFLRKGEKNIADQSIYKPIGIAKDGTEKILADILEDDTFDFVSEYEDQITYNEVRKAVYNLPDRDREIILLYFGFIDNHQYTQNEIAEKFQMSRSYVSRLITKIVKRIGIQLQANGVIETVGKIGKKSELSSFKAKTSGKNSPDPKIDDYTTKKSNISKDKRKNEKMSGKKLQTIYEYLKEYTREEIDAMLSKLSDEEMLLIRLRYGDDLENPVSVSTWGEEETNKFYGKLIPKMKRLLSNPDGKRKNQESSKKAIAENLTFGNIQPSNESVEKNSVTSQVITQQEPQKEITKQFTSEIQKDDCLRILELMRNPSFGEMLKTLTPKEAVIICLKLGYIDGKYFTTESIAGFLGVEKEEVIETTKKVLLLYKENINQFIDKAVEVAVAPSLVLKKK